MTSFGQHATSSRSLVLVATAILLLSALSIFAATRRSASRSRAAVAEGPTADQSLAAPPPAPSSARNSRSAEDEDKQQARALEFVESQFQQRSTDESSARTERELRAAIERIGNGTSRLVSVKCVTTMCKFVVTLASAGAAMPFIMQLNEEKMLQTERLYGYADGGKTLTVFMALNGSTLPRLAAGQ
jgi:hypothetical protein